MAQASFAELEHDLKKRRTWRELFLEKMDKLVLERRRGGGRRPDPLSVTAAVVLQPERPGDGGPSLRGGVG